MTFDLSWNAEQLDYRASVLRFAQEQLGPDGGATDEPSFSRETWRRCGEFGIQGLPFPVDYGGGGADPLTVAMALEALGYGCRDNGLLFSLNAHMWSAAHPIVRFGDEEQKQRYLPGLCDGTLIGVQAMTEPGSGSDAMALATTAVPTGDGYLLNGAKTFITNAPVADLFVVFATADRSLGWAGLSAFLVEGDTPGVSVGAPFRKMGLTSSPMSEVLLTDCKVPERALLGRRGAGMAVFRNSMDWERSFILATAVGTMQRQLETCVERARTRRQFGRHIGEFQAVSHRLVEMRLRLKAARLGLYELAWLKAHGRASQTEAAEVKLVISEAFVQSSLDAVYLHGGDGYMSDAGLERDVRDALAGRIYSGTSDIQRELVAKGLGL